MAEQPKLIDVLGAAFAENFGVRCVHLPGAAVALSGCYSEDDLQALRYVEVVDSAYVDPTGRQHQSRIEPAQIADEIDRGRTICADISHAPAVQPLLEELASWVPNGVEPPFAKLYVSSPGAGFAMHMDAHHVFVIQLSGRKRWQVTDPAAVATMFGGKLAGDRPVHTWPRDGEPIVDEDGEPIPAPTELRTIELAPGDVLYMPPGAWHTTSALTRSMAVSLSPPRAPALRLVLALLEQELTRRGNWRTDLFRGPASAGPLPAGVAATLDHCAKELAEVVGAIDGTLLRRAWAMSALPPLAGSRPGARVALTRSSPLVHADLRGFFTVDARDAVHLVFAGGEVELPAEARGFVLELAKHPSFRADEALRWDPRLSWDEARDLLQELVAVGLLCLG